MTPTPPSIIFCPNCRKYTHHRFFKTARGKHWTCMACGLKNEKESRRGG